MAVESFADIPANVSKYHKERAEPEHCAVCERTPVVHRLRVRLDEYDNPRPDTTTMKQRIHAGTRTDGIAEFWLCDSCGNKPMTFELRHNEDGDGLTVVHLLDANEAAHG